MFWISAAGPDDEGSGKSDSTDDSGRTKLHITLKANIMHIQCPTCSKVFTEDSQLSRRGDWVLCSDCIKWFSLADEKKGWFHRVMNLFWIKRNQSSTKRNDTSEPGKRIFSIKWRFTLVIGSLLTLSFILLFTTFYWVFFTHSMTELKSRAHTIAKSIAASGTTPLLGGNLGTYNKLTFDFLRLDKDIAYIITDLTGKKLMVYNIVDGLPAEIYQPYWREDNGYGDGDAERFIEAQNSGIWEAKVPFMGNKGEIRVGMADTNALSAIKKSQMVMGSIMLISLVIGVLTSLVLSRQLTRPLISLAFAADQISIGNMKSQIDTTRYNDEIRMLSESVERMRNSFIIAIKRMR